MALFKVLCLCLGGVHFASGAFHQTHFAIGGGLVPPLLNESYSLLQDAGMTFLHADSAEVASVAQAQQMASLCAEYNLSCLMPMNSYKAITPSSAVWGYFLRDEPPASEFNSLAASVAEMRKVHPDALTFVNLFGVTEDPTRARALYGVDTYEEYVDQYLATVKPDILCYDFYPSNATMWEYHQNLAFIRNKSLHAGIPFWNYVWMSANGNGVGAAFYRWELFVAATYGSKGLLQWSLQPCANPRDCGPKSRWVPYPTIMDKYGKAFPPVFDMVRAEHKPWKWLGPKLLEMESLNVSGPWPHHWPFVITGMPIRSISSGCANWLVGHFRTSSKVLKSRTKKDLASSTAAYDDCVMVVNGDPLSTHFATLDLGPAGPGAVREVSQSDGQLVPLVDAAPDVPGFQLFFLEGAGRLLCWSNSDHMSIQV